MKWQHEKEVMEPVQSLGAARLVNVNLLQLNDKQTRKQTNSFLLVAPILGRAVSRKVQLFSQRSQGLDARNTQTCYCCFLPSSSVPPKITKSVCKVSCVTKNRPPAGGNMAAKHRNYTEYSIKIQIILSILFHSISIFNSWAEVT